jgi:hypothetical protein
MTKLLTSSQLATSNSHYYLSVYIESESFYLKFQTFLEIALANKLKINWDRVKLAKLPKDIDTLVKILGVHVGLHTEITNILLGICV